MQAMMQGDLISSGISSQRKRNPYSQGMPDPVQGYGSQQLQHGDPQQMQHGQPGEMAGDTSGGLADTLGSIQPGVPMPPSPQGQGLYGEAGGTSNQAQAMSQQPLISQGMGLSASGDTSNQAAAQASQMLGQQQQGPGQQLQPITPMFGQGGQPSWGSTQRRFVTNGGLPRRMNS